MSGAAPDFDGDQQCWLTGESANDEGGQRSESCAAPMPLTDKVSLAKAEGRYANCAPRPGGGARCYCSVGNSSFGFQVSGAPIAASCASSILNCDDEAVLQATGAASCQPSSLTAYTDSCEADLSCLQAATVDERQITAEGRLVLACARVEPGEPW